MAEQVKNIHPSAVFSRSWSVCHELEEGRVALFDEEKSELLVLNPIGGAIWELVDGKNSVQQIVQELASVETAPSEAEIQEEVARFINDLLGRHALEQVLL